MRFRSPKGRKREANLRAVKSAAAARNYGRCEVPGCGREGTDLAHLFGRRHILRAPECDAPWCTRLMCRPHHRAMDTDDLNLQHRMRWLALGQYAHENEVTLPDLGSDPVAYARFIDRGCVL